MSTPSQSLLMKYRPTLPAIPALPFQADGRSPWSANGGPLNFFIFIFILPILDTVQCELEGNDMTLCPFLNYTCKYVPFL